MVNKLERKLRNKKKHTLYAMWTKREMVTLCFWEGPRLSMIQRGYVFACLPS